MQYGLRELRARANETQRETAAAVGISYQQYCKWEKDISNVSVLKVARVAKHFHVSLDEIKLE